MRPIYNKEAEKNNTINLRRVATCVSCIHVKVGAVWDYDDAVACTKHPELIPFWLIAENTICDDYEEFPNA